MDWFLQAFRQYVDFKSRSRRKAYWMFFLVQTIAILACLIVVGGIIGRNLAYNIVNLYLLLSIIPTLALTARRLHDTGRSAYWMLLGFVPALGSIAIIVLCCIDSETGSNKWGPNPKLESTLTPTSVE